MDKRAVIVAAVGLASQHVVTMSARQSGKTDAMRHAADSDELRAQYMQAPEQPPELPIPRRLSIDPNSPDFHPSYQRVGVKVDGVERNDLQWYDLDRKEYMTTAKTSHLAESIEPYWRYAESRQMRRARERWEAKHK